MEADPPGENAGPRNERKDPRRARSDHSPKHERTRIHESELNTRPSHTHKNGETPRKRRESGDESARTSKHGDSDAERHSHRRSKRQSPSDPRRRSRSPSHRRSSPRRHKSRSRSRSPVAHKRGDPRANAERNRQICYEFSRGTCTKGSSCKFLHEESEVRRSVHERQDSRGKNRKVDESHDRQTQEQAQGAMPTNGIAQQGQRSDWPSVPALNHIPQPFGGNTSYASVNGSQVWMPAPVQLLPDQNPLYQLPQPPPAPPPFIPFSDFPAVVSQMQQMPQQQQQDHTVANLREPPMEAFSPDMPGGRQNEEELGSGKSPTDHVEPEAEKRSPDIAESGEEPDPDADGGEGEKERKSKKKKKIKDSKSSMLVRIAVTEYVKEVLQPTWKEGKMSKDVYKTIAKKAVDKVVGTLQGNHIPKTQEKVDHFLEFSRQKISKLVQGYVNKYTKSAS